MEIELSKKVIDEIARRTALIVLRKLREEHEDIPEMVTCKEAAAILHIAPNTLRIRKDEFPHIKNGDKKQGKLLFYRKALLECYAK